MHEIDKAAFGTFLSEQRKKQGMTQKELAAKLFVTDKAISKWENGGGLPDITMLTPLAEVLKVTVAELLACQKLPESIAPERTDELVRTAIGMNELREKPARQQFAGFGIWMLGALVECLLLWLLGFQNVILDETTLTMMALCGGFAVYFWFYAPKTLPAYFDTNRVSAYSDGPLRMNVPGVRFTNRNWPYIVKALRHSLCALMVFSPLGVLSGLLLGGGETGNIIAKLLLLAVVLGGLFIPLYVYGKKYE